jgi:hypothetical protein
MSLAIMFALGLAGSLHCVQMCGPLVLSFGLQMPARAHAAYHLGRILTYAALGMVAGWFGSGVALAGAMAGVQNAAAIVGGVLMIAAGMLITAPAVRGNQLIRIGPGSRLSRVAGKLLRITSPRGKFAMGLVMGLLPCGLIYAALLRSVAAASPLSGAMNMAAFGAGTAGPLFGLGVFSVTITRWIGLRGQNWAAAGVLLMGAVLLWRGLADPALHLHHMQQAYAAK